MKPASALICGLVRKQDAMLGQLSKLAEFRSDGLVERIVYSTWVRELDRYPEVRQALHKLDAIVVESEEPILRTHGHFLHQAKCLSLGLRACPGESLVLKLRPDLAPLTDQYRSLLSEFTLLDERRRTGPTIFNKLVWILDGITFWPFYLNDIVYLGTREDLLLLADPDLKFESYYNQLSPEQFFHMSPVLRRSPLMRAYARVQRIMVAGDRNGNQAYARAMLDTPLLLKAWLLSARFLIENYVVGFECLNDADLERVSSFKGVPIGSLSTGIPEIPGVEFHPFLQTTRFTSVSWAHALLRREFCVDEQYERVAEALQALDTVDGDIDNPVFAHPELIGATERLRSIYVHSGPKICVDPPGVAVRFVPDGRERMSLLSQTDEARALHEEITALRRHIHLLMTENSVLRQRTGGSEASAEPGASEEKKS